MECPHVIYSGLWKGGHCQGIAVDARKGYIYYSFTTLLAKVDFSGKMVGSVTGLTGHLGCIAFHPEDGRVYGSLEYKNDAIGRGIRGMLGAENVRQDAFYIAVFDVDKIDRLDMDATESGVMRAIYLKEVFDDYAHPGHRYGCSGIDGVSFGPRFGGGEERLYVAYGIYSDVERKDNDHQILLGYDVREWDKLAQPLCQDAPHTSGPEAPDEKLFVYTGNTTYGVQNLEYDPYTGLWLMAVYPGKKSEFPNPPLLAVDGSFAPTHKPLAGLSGEEGMTLHLGGNGLNGWAFEYGSTGLCALGDGRYYISHHGRTAEGQYSHARLYEWDGETPFLPAGWEENA